MCYSQFLMHSSYLLATVYYPYIYSVILSASCKSAATFKTFLQYRLSCLIIPSSHYLNLNYRSSELKDVRYFTYLHSVEFLVLIISVCSLTRQAMLMEGAVQYETVL
jgi:hypothetical protein